MRVDGVVRLLQKRGLLDKEGEVVMNPMDDGLFADSAALAMATSCSIAVKMRAVLARRHFFYRNTRGNTQRRTAVSISPPTTSSLLDGGFFALPKIIFGGGGDTLIIDEVHRSPDWTREVKSIIDTYPKKHLWLSGSSSLALAKGGADLSRRVLWYELGAMTFREFLEMEAGTAFRNSV